MQAAFHNLIAMLRDSQPSSSDTSSLLTFMNSSRTATTRSSCNSASVLVLVQHHGKNELLFGVGVLIWSVHGHHGLLFTSRQVGVVTTLSKVEASLIVTFSMGSTSDCEISSSWSSWYTMAQSASRTTSCIIAEGTGTGHFRRSVAEDLHDPLHGLTTGVGTGTSTFFHHWYWNLLEHLLSHDLRHWNVHCLQLRFWIWSLDRLCGDLRHWPLLNGRGLRHVRSSFHHLRRDPRHENGDLFAFGVIHVVAQPLFPSFDTQGLQPRIRILESTDHCAFAVVVIKLELRVLLEVRSALVHIVTAVHSTSRPDTAFRMWIGLLSSVGLQPQAPLPCATRKSCGVCRARQLSCRGRPVVSV